MNRPITHNEKSLSQTDILTILSAADSIIGVSGRTMLAKILKGSRDKKLLGLGLDACSSYGSFRDKTIEAITDKIDWMIKHDFLAIEMSGIYPMIVFTDRGWTIERMQMVEKLLLEWDVRLARGKTDADMSYLKDRNREMILLFLERVKSTGDAKYIPFLHEWAKIDYKKVQAAIHETIQVLEKGKPDALPERLQYERQLADDALNTYQIQPERLKCWDCGERFIFEVEEQKFFRMKGFDDPKRCPACRERKWLMKMGIDPEE